MDTRDLVLALLIVAVGAGVFYLLDPTLGGIMKKKHEGFLAGNGNNDFNNNNNNSWENNNNVLGENGNSPGVNGSNGSMNNGNANNNDEAAANINGNGNAFPPQGNSGPNTNAEVEGFESMTPAPMPFKDAEKPANCYPKDQINPQELLPNDPNSKWAQVNPMGQGDIAGKNYLSGGALIGINTVGESLRNANYQLRSDPPNPQVKVSIWNQSTIEPDINRRPLEIA